VAGSMTQTDYLTSVIAGVFGFVRYLKTQVCYSCRKPGMVIESPTLL
jgi:hypothetical protein